jgi:hypothetical protein
MPGERKAASKPAASRSEPAPARPGAAPAPTEPVSVVDGLADRSRNPAAWKYAAIAAIFVLWAAFLIYCLVAGRMQ